MSPTLVGATPLCLGGPSWATGRRTDLSRAGTTISVSGGAQRETVAVHIKLENVLVFVPKTWRLKYLSAREKGAKSGSMFCDITLKIYFHWTPPTTRWKSQLRD